MTKRIRTVLLFCMIVLPCISFSQQFSFPTYWKFIMQDDPAFSQPGFNETNWETIPVPAGWENLGINKEKTVGWYRVQIELPGSLLNKDLVFFAGAIDDADETYFNGHLIGNTGKFPPGDQTAWDIERKYIIKEEWVKKKNSMSIKVYNGGGGGGIYSGSIMIISRQESDRRIAAQIKSKKSYYQLTTSNGLIAAVYNEESGIIENVYPHIFSFYDSGKAVKPFVQNIRLKTPQKPLSTSYEKNTHIIRVTYKDFSIRYLAPFTTAEKIFYAIVSGNPEAIKNISFVSEKANGELLSTEAVGINLGSAKYFLFSFKDSLHDNNQQINAATKRLQDSKHKLAEQEIAFMQALFKKSKLPLAISAQERNAAEQSITVLKMSQVSEKEIFPLLHGQVLASLRPGVWAISWVRDAAFAIKAMSKLGMYDEARKALEFMLKAKPTNQYIHYIHTDGKDYGIGVPYIISVTRYFGNGREESDYNADGPNIEIDDLGLFLTAFYHYVNETGDKTFFNTWKNALDTIGNAIIHNINAKNIIRTESGPWEHHLPGKEFMWTSGTCARGLQLTAILQKRFGHPHQKFEEAYKTLYKGILANCLIDGKYIKGNATELSASDHHYFDAATFELFANGLITDKKLFATHMQEYNGHNRAAKDAARGYIRFNSADSYENQEWAFAGLRVAVAQTVLGNKAEAKKLIDRITGFANRNNNQVPEILSNDMNIYRGAIPMVGYGAGAYILSVLAYYQNK